MILTALYSVQVKDPVLFFIDIFRNQKVYGITELNPFQDGIFIIRKQKRRYAADIFQTCSVHFQKA